jgi:hypothetical protein
MRARTNTPRSLLAGASLCLLVTVSAPAQTSSDVREILSRLERLEQANRELVEEVKALRTELAGARPKENAPPPAEASPPVEERVAVLESRVEEQASSKVEASQRLPIRLTGMALFNAYLNSAHGGDMQYPSIATPDYARTAGATMRQTIIGLDYRGAETSWGGTIRGAVSLDLFGGQGYSMDPVVRFRTGQIAVDWHDSSFVVGVDKPIISARDPASFAQVGYSPLWSSGNLWRWMPQARFEQDFRFSDQSGLRVQVGVLQTKENFLGSGDPEAPPPETYRPAVEGRAELHFGKERRFEIAPGFHYSVTHVGGFSVPSEVFSVDWLAKPWRPIEFSGAFFHGQNVAAVGSGGADPGYILSPTQALPVHSTGGWAQFTWLATRRISFNLFGGEQDNRNTGLSLGQIDTNASYGANVFYRLAPNVIVSMEAAQVRTARIGAATVSTNHYDLALAYLF